MSHFTTIKTKLAENDILLKALQSLGHVPYKDRRAVRGFLGAETPVDICIPTKNPAYDIGFRKNGDSYEMVADWYGIRDFDQKEFIQRLTQHYAYHATCEKLQAQGFSVATQETEEDGRIHLVLRRTA
jgi:homospermidine synthase